VSLPRFLAEDADLRIGARVQLSGDEGRHAATVRRLRVGEQVELGDGRGTVATCVVTGVGRGGLACDVRSVATSPLPAPRIVVAQALAKGARGELAVELLTEVGVDVVVPWAAARCVTRWDAERRVHGLARWRSTARAAAKQSRRAWLPEVREPARITDVVELLRAAARGLVLSEAALQPLAAVEVPPVGDVVLVVGPEGGLAPEELSAFAAAGAVDVRLGPTVLRTSSAGAAAVAVVSARCARWA
jgi:16S rRNA (uracil1498-N3)-methyltransferase